MNLNKIYPVLDLLRNTTSTNQKLEILRNNILNDDLKLFFKYVLDGSIIFWITPPEEDIKVSGKEYIVPSSWFAQFTQRKVTGNAAKAKLREMLESLTPECQDVLKRIFERDAKCGVADGLVNKTWDNLVKVFSPMKGDSIDDYAEIIDDLNPELITGRLASIKIDGKRTVIFKNKDSVAFLSSSGKPVYNLEDAIPEILALPYESIIIDCEFFDKDWSSSASISSSKVNKKSSDTWKLYAFDILTLEEWEGCGKNNFYERDAILTTLLKNGSRLVKTPDLGIVKDVEHLKELFEKAVSMGYEGLVLKDLNYKYERDRVRSWLKAKPVETVDVQIVDMVTGKKGTKRANTLGAFVCVDKNGVQFECGNSFKGSLTDSIRDELWNRRGELIGTFIEVLQDKLPKRSAMKTRFPRFVKLRPDKNSF